MSPTQAGAWPGDRAEWRRQGWRACTEDASKWKRSQGWQRDELQWFSEPCTLFTNTWMATVRVTQAIFTYTFIDILTTSLPPISNRFPGPWTSEITRGESDSPASLGRRLRGGVGRAGSRLPGLHGVRSGPGWSRLHVLHHDIARFRWNYTRFLPGTLPGTWKNVPPSYSKQIPQPMKELRVT